MWVAIQYVSSALTLIAFLAAIAAWIYRQQLLKSERLIRAAPEADRAALVQSALEVFQVDTSGLTKAQQFEIAITQIRARGHRFSITAAIVGLLAVLAFVVAIVAIRVDANTDGLKTENTTLREQMSQKVAEINQVQSQLALLVRGVERAAGTADALRRDGPAIDGLASQLDQLLAQVDSGELASVALTDSERATLAAARKTLAEAMLVSAQVVFNFSNYEDSSGIPDGPILPDNCQFELVARRASSSAPATPASGWQNRILMENPELHLQTSVQDFDRQSEPTVDGTTEQQIMTFFQFAGDLGPFVDPAAWKDADFECLLRAKGASRWLRERRTRSTEKFERFFDAFYGIPAEQREQWSNSDYQVTPKVTAEVRLMVNGKQVARLHGIVARVWEHDEDVRDLHVARFIPRELPEWEPDDPPDPISGDSGAAD